MKRRTFGLLASTSVLAVKFGAETARAAGNPAQLTTTLMPLGGERAGNADGSIPEWTGGLTTVPAGWQPGQSMPDPFANEQPILVVDSSNMSKYTDMLSVGVQQMMTKYGYSIKVYPTHRTACAPQEVYDNTAQNVTRAQLSTQGPQFGFSGAFGGLPFPILDSDPLVAGAQIILNHNSRWQGYKASFNGITWVVSSGSPVLASITSAKYDYPYYLGAGSQYISRQLDNFTAPSDLIGEQVVILTPTNFTTTIEDTWELLTGQGRVRRAPELSYDTPNPFADGIINVDETNGFFGSPERFDYKLIGKKEYFIPYNCNGVVLLPPSQILKEHFPDPDLIRWEKHRVWLVEATVRAGQRNVIPRRLFYVDEDTFIIGLVDEYDANNNLYKADIVSQMIRPDLPGSVLGPFWTCNLQVGDYIYDGYMDEKANPSIVFSAGSWPDATFDPQTMAASAQY